MDKLNFDISNQVNKGFELVRQGKLDEAEQLFSKVLMSKAEEENSLLALGIINYEKKRFQIAKVYLEKVVAKQPNNFKAYLFLGLTEVALNEINKAVSAFLEAIKIQPDFVESIVSCADAYKKLRCYDEAIEFYEKAMKLQPSNPVLELACAEAYFFRGRLYFQKEELQFALANFSKAYEFGKKDVECLYNLAETYRLLQESEKALELYEQILVVAPNSISTLVAKGVLLKDLARYKESKDTLNKALKISHGNPVALYNLSLIDLLMQNYERGFANYEIRVELFSKIKKFLSPAPVKRRWDGTACLAGKTILLIQEQGVGDQIQAIRFVKQFVDLGAKVLLLEDDRLTLLFKSLPWLVEFVSEGQQYDYWFPMMSTMKQFIKSESDIKPQPPYLFAEKDKKAFWTKRLSSLGGDLNVGIAWRGGAEKNLKELRSLSFVELGLVTTNQKINFINLQYDSNESEGEDFNKVHNRSLLTLEGLDLRNDFTALAAVLTSLDLVITVDNTVVHLVGALGVPAWLLLPKSPDWRWQLDREDSPWYPSLRLFRQKELGNWEEVIVRVKAELDRLVKQQSS